MACPFFQINAGEQWFGLRVVVVPVTKHRSCSFCLSCCPTKALTFACGVDVFSLFSTLAIIPRLRVLMTK